MPLLTIQLDLIAQLREWRRAKEPDPAQAAVLCELAGADGIAVQMRQDRALIRDRDLYMLREIIKTRFLVEISPTDTMLELMSEIKPTQINLTAEGTADAPAQYADFSGSVDLKGIVSRLNGQGMMVALLAPASVDAIRATAKAGAQGILLDAWPYASARTLTEAQTELDRLDALTQQARKAGLAVSVIRGLNTKNLPPLVELGTIEEFIIGHALISRAAMIGIDTAVRDYLDIIRTEPPRK